MRCIYFDMTFANGLTQPTLIRHRHNIYLLSSSTLSYIIRKINIFIKIFLEQGFLKPQARFIYLQLNDLILFIEFLKINITLSPVTLIQRLKEKWP